MTSEPTSEHLANACVDLAVARLEALIDAHMPDFRLPRVFAGHAVGPDVRADLAFTLGLLLAGGVTTIAGRDVRDALEVLLPEVDGRRTHTFYSYRVAETLVRMGAAAPLPSNLSDACDSTDAIPALDRGTLPRNYAAVLARCEIARADLGLISQDDEGLRRLLERTGEMLTDNTRGFLDDSRSGVGRYDIYTADVYLFTEPFARRLGDAWTRGAAAAVDLVERVASPSGAAFPWGRSTGALGIALTVELAALVARYRVADPAAWIARGTRALRTLDGWFGSDGVVRAHQYRSTFAYRGPHRRLQMTLDLLGKVADAALVLSECDPVTASPLDECFPDRNELVEFDSKAKVWTYRSRNLAFAHPLAGPTVSDYLPGPRNPGLFETPVDSGLVTALPFAVRSGTTYAPAGPPASAGLRDGRLETRHDRFLATGLLEVADDTPALDGAQREAVHWVDGRTLRVDEHLRFEGQRPHAVALQVAEADGRPLHVRAWNDAGALRTTPIDTAGIKEWRSFWGELPVVHQVDLEPSPDMRFSWSVTPKLRVLSTAHEHHYHRTLYDPLSADVVDARFPLGRMNDGSALTATLDRCDIFHLHWPEWLFGADIDRHRALIDALKEQGVRIVWTQHNLIPHAGDPRMTAVYSAWAAASDAALHHSSWGQEQVLARYEFARDPVHAIVPHPHFGPIALRTDNDRSMVEQELGLQPRTIRLGVVGAPRPGKDVAGVLRAFARCRRPDLELLVFSLGPDDEVPDDPRIRAFPYEMVPREVYERRLSAIDVVVLPFSDHGMLTTGVVGDVVAHGLPALTTSWPFLREVLGEAGIVYGATEDDLVSTLDGLDAATLDRASRASVALQSTYEPERVAHLLLTVLERIGTTRI